jgi:hypothetical protein
MGGEFARGSAEICSLKYVVGWRWNRYLWFSPGTCHIPKVVWGISANSGERRLCFREVTWH